MKVDCLWPHLISLAFTDQSGYHNLAIVGANKVHQVFLTVLSVHNTKIGVYALVCALKIHTLLEQGDQLLPVAELLVEGIEIFKMIGVDDNVLTAKSCHVELLSADTGEADSFPYFWHIGFSGCLESQLVLFQVDISLREFLVV